MISGGADKLLKVWDLATALEGSVASGITSKGGKLKATAATAAHDKDINAVAVAPNDSLICSASQDRTAKVRTNLCRHIVEPHCQKHRNSTSTPLIYHAAPPTTHDVSRKCYVNGLCNVLRMTTCT